MGCQGRGDASKVLGGRCHPVDIHVVQEHPTIWRAMAAQVICVATVSNERGFSNMELNMMRPRNSLGVEMLEQFMRISIEALDHWRGLKERRVNRDWEVPSKLVLARWVR